MKRVDIYLPGFPEKRGSAVIFPKKATRINSCLMIKPGRPTAARVLRQFLESVFYI